MSFVHLHVHTQYSILDGFSSIKKLFARCRELGMPAVAITDHGNMYGVKEFFKWANDKSNKNEDGSYKVKPLIGCEMYVTRHFDYRLKDKEHSRYYHLILLAKNYNGYKNLVKLVSLAHTEGNYYRPRISHELLEQYHQDLICCSACLAGEIPQDILVGDMDAASKAIEWHKNLFGEDYYLEVMLHKSEVPDLPVEAQQDMNDLYRRQKLYTEEIFSLAQKHSVKVVVTNDAHFVRKEDGPAHDHLICLTTNSMVDDAKRLRYTQQEYIKSRDEMSQLFPEHPEVLDNTLEVAEKIEAYSIDRDHVLPKYEIDPAFLSDIEAQREKYKDIIDAGKCDAKGNDRGEEFCNSVAFLCHLAYKGAHDPRRYGETLSEDQQERMEFELKTISRMGFPDYFLIVQDYIAAMRSQGWLIGPGRGSAAGSVVAYCLGITNLDPIKYDLLFERFLNPDRISMPDIDVDFENLPAAHRYVEDKYGKDHVSRVITFGTMAAKSAIQDIARIRNVSIPESNRLKKMIPDHLTEKVEVKEPFNPKLDTLKSGFKVIEEDGMTYQRGMEDKDVKITLSNCFRLVPEFKEELENGDPACKEVLKYAEQLEGCIRQVGMHACATIIGRGNLTDYIPITLSKDKDTDEYVWTSQYDGHFIEDVGMLKMDFLGLITLSIIKETLLNIQKRHGGDLIDMEAIPIDDKAVFEVYGKGDTDCLFQFESPGMKKWLQKLHPERFEDLIAMNALYRPGPMDYIPDFVERKQGRQKIEYDLPGMEEYLAETYGITVYQEQVMLLSRKLANFTRGESDKLRKAMGKKQKDVMAALKEKFMTNGIANGHPEKTLDKIWKDWEKFASYAFNKSHATCYAWVSYQTAWLKCHYTAEFLAANLSCNLSKMDEIKKIMADCKLHKIAVLNPDVNESDINFTVNKDGNIRFGLGGIKSFGSNVADAIIKEREDKGLFKNINDFAERLSGILSRKPIETLALSGAFDSMGIRRSQFFQPCESGRLYIDELVRYIEMYREDTLDSGSSLFGDIEEMKPQPPQLPEVPKDEDVFEYLQKEKELVGMYLSSHPLDKYEFEIKTFSNCELSDLDQKIKEAEDAQGKPQKVSIAGMISSVNKFQTKSGKPAVKFVLEDFSGNYEIALFGNDVELFLPYVREHESVLLDGEIAARFRPKPGPDGKVPPAGYEFKIRKASLLGNVNENNIISFNIHVSSSVINPDFRSKLKEVIKTHKGKTEMRIVVFDEKKGYVVEFKSRKFGVNVCMELIADLSELGLSYSVKRK